MALETAQAASRQILVLVALNVVIGLAFLAFLLSRHVVTKGMPAALGLALAILYMLVVTALFVASVARPFFPADVAPRAATVPLLMGGFVFFGTYLAWLAHKYLCSDPGAVVGRGPVGDGQERPFQRRSHFAERRGGSRQTANRHR